MEDLSQEVRELARRLKVVEDVMTAMIEEQDRATSVSAPVSAPAPVRSAESVRSSVGAEVRAAYAPTPPLARGPSLAEKFAKRAAVNWLGAVSVICFVLAAAFIIKLAVDTGWLTPARQIGLAAVFGLSLIAVGLQLVRFDRSYASLLPGAGILVLYLTAVASHAYHHLISAQLALALIAAVSAICIWLYIVIEHEVYPVTAALGAYLLPFLLEGTGHTEFLLYYHVACSISFATISVWLESRLLILLAAYLAIGASFAINQGTPFQQLDIWIVAAHFAIFLAATVLYSAMRKRQLTAQEAWAYLPVLMLFYATEYSMIQKFQPGLAPYVSLVFAGVFVAFYFLGRKALEGAALESTSVVAAYASMVVFHSFYLELLDDRVKPWLLAVIAIAAAFTMVRKTSQKIPVFIVFLIAIIEYCRMFFGLIDSHADLNTQLSALAGTRRSCVSLLAAASVAQYARTHARLVRCTCPRDRRVLRHHSRHLVACRFGNVAQLFTCRDGDRI